MATVRFEVQGVAIQPERMMGTVSGRIALRAIERLEDDIERALWRVRCLEHGDAPFVTVVGPEWDTATRVVIGCCDLLRDEALALLTQR
jgi:hypothetical protein